LGGDGQATSHGPGASSGAAVGAEQAVGVLVGDSFEVSG
jgi:hypothetical protein